MAKGQGSGAQEVRLKLTGTQNGTIALSDARDGVHVGMGRGKDQTSQWALF